jgi:hypothetical protein
MKVLSFLPQRLDSGATPTFTGLLAGDGTAAAPSLSFAADTDTGFYRHSANIVGFGAAGARTLLFGTGGNIFGASTDNLQYVSMPTSGAVTVAAGGTNQNITLTPSGTGTVVASAGLRLNSANSSLGLYTDNGTDWVGLRVVSAAIRVDGGTIFPTGGIDLFTASNSGLRIQGNGRVLIGTLTDSGALLQLGTNTTTSAGGIGFGTDVSLFRLDANTLKVQPTGSSKPILLYGDATVSGVFNALAGFEAVYFNPTAHSLILATDGNTRVTIASTGNATFTGNVAVRAALGYATGIHSGATTDSNQQLILSSSGAYSNAYVSKNGTTLGIGFSSSNGIFVEDNALSIVASTKAATFAGAITTIGGAFLLATSTALTGGATGNVPTLSTGPVTGNPTKWIAINDNGTTRYVPAW